MKIKVNHKELLDGVQAIQNVIPTRATLPILSNFLFETQKDSVRIVATDLDLGVSKIVKAEVLEEGGITIPARRFGEIIKEAPQNEDINIQVKKNNSIHIACGACFFKLMGIPREEFPKIPKIEKKETLTIEQKELRKILDLTSFAISHNEARYVLNGALFNLKDKTLNVVATDGRRLAFYKHTPENGGNDFQMIVPIKAIQELCRSLKEEGNVKIICNENHVCFDLSDTLIISRLTEGDFPNYAQVIPEEVKNKIKIKREAFLQAVKRTSLFATAESLSIKLDIFKDRMTISKIVPEIGEAKEDVGVEYGGKEFTVGFNPYYLMDVLKNLKDEDIYFELQDAEKPGVIRAANYVYIILPMQLG